MKYSLFRTPLCDCSSFELVSCNDSVQNSLSSASVGNLQKKKNRLPEKTFGYNRINFILTSKTQCC